MKNKIFRRLLIILLASLVWLQTGANPTIVSYNATSSLHMYVVRFEKKMYFLLFWKTL
jgi:hypothetical protein